MANAIAKISKEAKRIKRMHPHKYDSRKNSWSAYIAEASLRYNRGSIGKAKPKKKKATKKRAVAKKHRPRKKRVVRKRVHVKKVSRPRKRIAAVSGVKTRRRRSRPRYKVTHKVRRVGASGGGGMSTNTLLMLGGLAIGAYFLLRPKSATTATVTQVPGAPPLQLTTNQQRNNQAAEIIAWATAGGMAIDAVIKLINSLNTKSDAQVSQVYGSIAGGDGVPEWALI